MTVAAPGKLLVLALVALGCIVYIILAMFVARDIDPTPGWALLGSIVGYLVGNGAGARRGIEQAPVFAPPHEG